MSGTTLRGHDFTPTPDGYATGFNHNVRQTAAVTVATDGNHTLRATINGRNGSAVDYDALFTRVAFVR